MLGLLQEGGVTMALLLVCAGAMVAVVWDRVRQLRAASTDSLLFLAKLGQLVSEGRKAEARGVCEKSPAAVAAVAGAALAQEGRTRAEARDAIAAATTQQRHRLNRRLPLVGTIASTAPFIGLFGTVVGIMKTFRSMSMATGGAMPDVSRGISEALIATAGGLAVAIVAVGAYNYLQIWVQRFEVEFEVVGNEVLQMLREPTGWEREGAR